ncbi:MAG: aminopeptidase P family N-terminal domain-containing protein, partial [Nitrospiria bacterium]
MNSRLSVLRAILSSKNLDAAIISSVPNVIWLTGYAGFSREERECYLLITKSNSYLFTDLRYTEAARLIPYFQTRESNRSSPFSTQLTEIAKNENLKTIGCETNNLTVDEFLKLKEAKLQLVSLNLSELRIRKDLEG